MNELVNTFHRLRRPRLLIQAARIGAALFQRERDLRRLLKSQRLPRAGAGLPRLIALEAELEHNRKTKTDPYNISRHVEILAALMVEARCISGQG